MRSNLLRLYHIKNISNPICIDCVHFIKNKPYNKDLQSDDKYGKCGNFGMKDLVTGEIIYELASISRREINKCKPDGLFFTPRYEMPITRSE